MTDVASVSVDTGSSPLVIGVADDLTLQLPRRFREVHLDTVGFGERTDELRAALHVAVQHLAPGGELVVRGPAATGVLIDELRLEPIDDQPGSESEPTAATPERRLRRGTRFTVHDLLFEARDVIRRVTPLELAELLVSVAPPVVVDTRTHADRERHGVITGSIHVPRTVLEWHLDPINGYRHPAVTSFDQPLIVVCDGGYSSSIAAANLGRIGFTDVSDLVGGHRGWVAAGLDVTDPDHSHVTP